MCECVLLERERETEREREVLGSLRRKAYVKVRVGKEGHKIWTLLKAF